MTHKTPGELRNEAAEALREPGQRRIELLAALEALDAELRPLVREARRMEVPIRRITELTAVAPNTVRAWAKPEGSEAG
jgi:hypothetical protein